MKIWFTLTGTNHYCGQDFLKKGTKIRLEKEPDNRHDREAIKVLMDGVGHIGYVANSPWTVVGESFSAGVTCITPSSRSASSAFSRSPAITRSRTFFIGTIITRA